MVLDALLLAVVLWGLRVARRTASSRGAYLLLPTEDQPPDASDDPWPPARSLDRYVHHGLDEIDLFLARGARDREF
jgi:cbb3-type cytochrome oxidase subunit 3